MPKTAFVYSDALASYGYGEAHPFKPIRARNALELCRRFGLWFHADMREVEPEPADPSKLLLFHEEAYLDALRTVSRGEFSFACLERGIGTSDCPALLGIWEFGLGAVGATLAGMELLLAGEVDRALSLVGGFHHAYPDHAEGFCYVSDVGVAIREALGRGLKVAFVDLDAHHCNGLQQPFYEEDRVLIISLHESGASLYPYSGSETEIGEGRGRGYNVNLPLLEQTDDETYRMVFERIVPPLLAAYGADLVIAEIGADTHHTDPLTHLGLTSHGYAGVCELLCRAAPRLLAVGGGGYNLDSTARCWTLAWAAMNELTPVDTYAGLVGPEMFGMRGGGLHDEPWAADPEARERARLEAERVAGWIEERVFPLVGAEPGRVPG